MFMDVVVEWILDVSLSEQNYVLSWVILFHVFDGYLNFFTYEVYGTVSKEEDKCSEVQVSS
jgi:hypothetical protein